jgi:hypothetical protein
METKLTKIFQEAKYEPDSKLARAVWGAIVRRDKLITRLKLWAFALLGLVSFGGLVPATQALFDDLTRSGFYEYFSLIFSDSRSVLYYWKELSFSLAESLPIVSTIFALSLIFACFLSLRYLMKQVGRNQLILSA